MRVCTLLVLALITVLILGSLIPSVAVAWVPESLDLGVIEFSSKVDPQVIKLVEDVGRVKVVIHLSRPPGELPEVTEVIEDTGGEVLRSFNIANAVLAYITPEGLRELVKLPGVKYVLPNYVVRVAVEDLKVVPPAALTSGGVGGDASPIFSWGLARVGAPLVWKSLNVTGEGAIIAFIDTGVNPRHSALRGKMFTIDPSDPRYPGGWAEFDRDGNFICSTPHDTDGHGSWVTSIAVGGDMSTEVLGVAPGAKFMHVLALHNGWGTVAQVLAALEWVADPYTCEGVETGVRPHAVSMSFGLTGNYTGIFLEALGNLMELGVVPIAAIGNGGVGTSSNPGNVWGVVGVGAVDRDDSVAYFSSGEVVEWPEPPEEWPFTGEYRREYVKPDFVAPGVMVAGAYALEGFYAIGSGTSASAPIVAGIYALLLDAVGRPLNVSEFYQILNKSVDRPEGLVGQDVRYGWGVVNAVRATYFIRYGRSLTDVDVSLGSRYVKVGDEVLPYVEGYSGYVEIFFDDIKVFEGVSTNASFRVPPADMGYHYVHVLGLERAVYGMASPYVTPDLRVSRVEVPAGESLDVELSGYPMAFMTYLYLGDNLLSLKSADLRGRAIFRINVPYLKPGFYLLKATDELGLAVTEAHIAVLRPSGEQVEGVVTPAEYLQVRVNSPVEAVVGEPVAIYVVTLRGGEPSFVDEVRIEVMGSRGPLPINLSVVGVGVGIYVAEFTLEEPGDYLVLVRATHSLGNSTFKAAGTASLRVVPTGPDLAEVLGNLSAEVGRINKSLTSLEGEFSRLTDLIEGMSNLSEVRFSELMEFAEELPSEVSSLKGELVKEVESFRNYLLASLVTAVGSLALLNALITYYILRKFRGVK